MPGLTFLDIRFNFFTGSVPPQIFMQTLDVLFINNNNFMQKLPENFGTTTALYLTLASNKFTGPIPRSIGKASKTLTEILLLDNMLTGCLPYELGFLHKLTLFDAENNQLTGPLPCSLGCLENLEILNLAGNLLYGKVPEELCALENLANLSLSNNYFTKVGPLCMKLVKDGVLDLRNNCVHYLPDQRPLKECVWFFLHPRFCQYPSSWFDLFPCRSRHERRHPLKGKKGSVSYAALSRHGH